LVILLEITETAAQKIKELMAERHKENVCLRLYIAGYEGSMDGPKIRMTFDESKKEEDILEEGYGISMIADKKVCDFFKNVTVNYRKTSNGGAFYIDHIRKRPCGVNCKRCGLCGIPF
jgi:iron-sulfur cluster assembly protein